MKNIAMMCLVIAAFFAGDALAEVRTITLSVSGMV